VLLPFLGALVAVILGHVARGELRRAPPGTQEGEGMALAGLILGYAQLALLLVGFGVVLLVFLGIGMAAAVHH
jgi:hypothetical protein